MNVGVCEYCGSIYEWEDEDPEICYECMEQVPDYREWTDD